MPEELKRFYDLMPKYLDEGAGNPKSSVVYHQKPSTVEEFLRLLNTEEALEHIRKDEKRVNILSHLSGEWLKAKFKTDNAAKITQLITQAKIRERRLSGIKTIATNIGIGIIAGVIVLIIWPESLSWVSIMDINASYYYFSTRHASPWKRNPAGLFWAKKSTSWVVPNVGN